MHQKKAFAVEAGTGIREVFLSFGVLRLFTFAFSVIRVASAPELVCERFREI
jgi:hypothetical protein